MTWQSLSCFLRADVGKLHRQFVGNLLMHRARDADAADLGQTFETCCDIDAIAKQIAVALNHVADGDADAKAHLAAGAVRHVPCAQAFLNVDRAAQSLDRAWKFSKHSIAGGVENTSASLGDKIVDNGSIGRHPAQRLFFVFGNQPAVAGDIGGKNSCNLALHDIGASHLRQDARGKRAVQVGGPD